jgi:hypothetical protein
MEYERLETGDICYRDAYGWLLWTVLGYSDGGEFVVIKGEGMPTAELCDRCQLRRVTPD